jgi:hypothetical protein
MERREYRKRRFIKERQKGEVKEEGEKQNYRRKHISSQISKQVKSKT